MALPALLLKGISLAASYPVPEYRKLGDLDLYINDKKDFQRAEQILHKNGYMDEEELSDHHTTYRYTFEKTGRSFLPLNCITVWWEFISIHLQIN